MLCQSLFQIVHTSVTMAVVAAKENTFMPGGPGTRVGQSNETFYRKRIPITCEEVKNISNSESIYLILNGLKNGLNKHVQIHFLL